jgi:hypothetical protein
MIVIPDWVSLVTAQSHLNQPLITWKDSTMVNPYTLDMAVKRLETMYPDKAPRTRLSDFEQGVMVGAMEVIDHLRKFRDGPPQ